MIHLKTVANVQSKQSPPSLTKQTKTNANTKLNNKTNSQSPTSTGKKVNNGLFKKRTKEQENDIMRSFQVNGLDQEDLNYLKRAYEQMVSTDLDTTDLDNDLEVNRLVKKIKWTDHCPTFVFYGDDHETQPEAPQQISRLNGCSRTHGYFKISSEEKLDYLINSSRFNTNALASISNTGKILSTFFF